MKNTFKYYAGMLLIGVTLANISCSSDEDGITPAEITNLTAESTSGRIVLRWDTPEDAGIRYIEVNYYDPLQKKDVMRTASIYADSIEIPDTRKKFGEYQFSVQTVSPTGDKSAVQTISKVSEPALPTFVSTQIALTAADLSTNAQEPTEGPIANLLDGIEVRLNTDYLENKVELDALADKVVYTGPIDAYFGYKLGTLEYRSVRFETETLDKLNFQGNAAVNYTDRETPWTRIIEHKWFEFGKDENGNDLPKTIISREYSSEWKPGDEPYYPVNDAKNCTLYAEYKKLADTENKVIFGGRLGEYKYYDMDQVIAAVLNKCEKEF